MSFVVPTIWRPTLTRTLDSLVALKDEDWEAVVVADPSFAPTLGWINDDQDRVIVVDAPESAAGSPGAVRNAGLPYVEGEWVGFVDDDDTLTPDYIDLLREAAADADLVLFRRRQCGSNIHESCELGPGAVGIHWAVRTSMLDGHRFADDGDEDWGLFKALLDAGARLQVSDRIAYMVWAGNERRL